MELESLYSLVRISFWLHLIMIFYVFRLLRRTNRLQDRLEELERQREFRELMSKSGRPGSAAGDITRRAS